MASLEQFVNGSLVHGRTYFSRAEVSAALDLNYGKFVEQGETRITRSDDYTSHNTEQLDVGAMKALLLKLDFIVDLIAGRLPLRRPNGPGQPDTRIPQY